MLTTHIEKSELVKALRVLKPLTDSSCSKPILSSARLCAKSAGPLPGSTDTGLSRRSWNHAAADATGIATMFATDFEASLGLVVEATVTAPGVLLLPVAQTLRVLRTAPAGLVLIRQLDQQWAMLEAGPMHFRFPVIDPGLYPGDVSAAQPFRFAVDGKAMGRAIDTTIPFSLKFEERKNLSGVHLRQKNGMATWTATDGRRMGRMEIPMECGESESPGVILPRVSLGAWRGALEWKKPGLVTVHFGDGQTGDSAQYVFMASGLMFTGRAIEGRFPSMDAIIPLGYTHAMQTDPKALKTLLEIAAAMSSELVKPVKLSLESGRLTAQSERAEYGDTDQTIPVEYAGKPFAIGMNAPYVIDVLRLANGHGTVRVGFKGPLNPLLFTYPEEPGFTGVVMPLRIEW